MIDKIHTVEATHKIDAKNAEKYSDLMQKIKTRTMMNFKG